MKNNENKKNELNNDNKKVVIGLSWPYANGRMHIGHVASSLPADALARFHRGIGNDVAFISGSDCYGTPILVSAKSEGVTPTELSDRYHALLKSDFESVGFTFDNYTKTTTDQHKQFVANFHREMYEGGYIYERAENQLFCRPCDKYLPDRYVEGICPFCDHASKGDSCDNCGKMIEAEELKDPRCKLCGGTPEPRMTKQLYIALSKLEPQIREFYESKKGDWANNAVGLTGRYLNEGLRDRAITRNIEWGVPLPSEAKSKFNLTDEEFAEKKIYIWAENVLGYLSATKEVCEARGWDFDEFYGHAGGGVGVNATQRLHYYVHAKDNIPFHTVILPGLLLANCNSELGKASRFHLPDQIVSSEYVKLGGAKLSKSVGNLITVHEMVEKYNSDMIRYYFLKHTSDKKDINFTEDEFITTINTDLVNGFGNLVNRSMSFINKNGLRSDGFGAEKVSEHLEEKGLLQIVNSIEKQFESQMYAGKVAKALAIAFELVTMGNKFFDETAPWKSVKEDREKCERDLSVVIEIIKRACELLQIFIPDAGARVLSWVTDLNNGKAPEIEILFKRLEKTIS